MEPRRSRRPATGQDKESHNCSAREQKETETAQQGSKISVCKERLREGPCSAQTGQDKENHNCSARERKRKLLDQARQISACSVGVRTCRNDLVMLSASPKKNCFAELNNEKQHYVRSSLGRLCGTMA